MKNLLIVFGSIVLFLLPNLTFGQAPALGTAANFVLFTSAGAVSNSGISQITGNVGTNSGTISGFGNVNGAMQDSNSITALCESDLLAAYNQLDTATPTSSISGSLGSGDTLIAGVYSISSAATLHSVLVLDARGNPAAVFIFQVAGTLSTAAYSSIQMINGAKAMNVFWKVEGMASMAAGTVMKGTVIAHNAAINISAGVALEGRALSTNGAITVNNILAHIPFIPGSLAGPATPALASINCYALFSSNGNVSNNGVTTITGDIGTNSGGASGFTSSLVNGIIHAAPDASTAICATDLGSAYSYINSLSYDIELLYPSLFGNNLVLTPHTYLLNAATTLTDTLYLDAEGNPSAVFVIQVNGSLSASNHSQVILINGAKTQNVYWGIHGAVNLGDSSVFNGTIVVNNDSIILHTGAMLYGRALTTTGAITTNNAAVIASTMPLAGTITGSGRLFIGGVTALSTTGDATGLWTASNAIVTISGGIATGGTPGKDTITYIVTNACGSDTASKIINVNNVSDVCVGSIITLTGYTTGGAWNSSNATATISGDIVTGVSAGLDTIRYIVNNSCGADTAAIVITIKPLPLAGTITGGSTVLEGSTLPLNDTVTSGTWGSLASTTATINSSGVVTGIAAGIDTIIYTVTNACGAASAQKIITIYVEPIAGNITGPSGFCVGTDATLTDSVTGGTWSASNAAAAINSAGVVTGNRAGKDTITYTVTNAYGSTNATKIITINALPLLVSSATGAPVCDSAVFSYTPLSDSAEAGFTWNRPAVTGISNSANSGAGSISEALVNTTVSPVAVTYIYSVTANGCSTIRDVSVVVNPTPRLAGSLSASICSGSPFNYASTSLTSGTTLHWDRAYVAGIQPDSLSGSNNIDEILTNNLFVPVDAIYRFTLVADGCTFQQNVVVIVNPVPSTPVITTKSPSPLCAGALYQNFGTSNLPLGGTVYSWAAINAVIWATGSNGQNALINFPNSGEAEILLSASLPGSPCQSSDADTVNVGSAVTVIPSIFYFEYHFVCLPSNLDAYQWGYDAVTTLDSAIFPGAINQDYLCPNPDYAHKYYWVNTSFEGCMQKTYNNPPLAIQNVNMENVANINLYPNPATETLNIVVNTAMAGELEVEVLNMTGQQLFSAPVLDHKTQIDVSNFPDGIYIVTCYMHGAKIGSASFVRH